MCVLFINLLLINLFPLVKNSPVLIIVIIFTLKQERENVLVVLSFKTLDLTICNYFGKIEISENKKCAHFIILLYWSAKKTIVHQTIWQVLTINLKKSYFQHVILEIYWDEITTALNLTNRCVLFIIFLSKPSLYCWKLFIILVPCIYLVRFSHKKRIEMIVVRIVLLFNAIKWFLHIFWFLCTYYPLIARTGLT